MPCVRAVATRRASPALASQAEKASRIMGADEKFAESKCSVHRDKPINRESIIPSKHKRADSRWVRWNAKPAKPRIKADEKAKWAGVIRLLWILTTSFWAETKGFV